jgi:hypothetical protein
MKKVITVLSKIMITVSAVLLLTNLSLAQMVINANMHISPGTFVHFNTDVEIENATLKAEEGSTIIMGDNRTLEVGTNATLDLKGADSDKVTVTSSGYFLFYVKDGGNISADHAIFEKMSGNGLEIQEGATVDPAFAFSNSIFRYGTANSIFLTINNDQEFAVSGVMFIATPGNELYNVSKTLDIGQVFFTNYSGNFAGEDFEDDEFNRLHWVPDHLTIEDLIIGMGMDSCFSAAQTITVGGDVTGFVVHASSSAVLVAGHSIIMLPGTIVEADGYLHAYISQDGIYCVNEKALVAAPDEIHAEFLQPEKMWAMTKMQVFPNPTQGKFTVAFEAHVLNTNAVIEIYSLMGELIERSHLSGNTRYNFDLSHRSKGVYLIRIIDEGQIHTAKVVVQ